MKLQYLWALPVAALLALASCSNDDMVPENDGKQNVAQDEVPAGMTEFAAEEASQDGITRTMGVYGGSGIKFYWTLGDKLWIKNTASLIQSKKEDITGTAATAKFYFDGQYDAANYHVRYTGNGNTTSNKVTIKSEQKQATPNDGSHIGTDGDCGTAIATRKADGKYYFTLSHKASYITFIPYYSHEFANDVKVTKIKVTANEVLAGEFDFNINGIRQPRSTSVNPKKATPGDPRKSITLTLKNGVTDGFSIPKQPDYTKNAAIMVLAPGTYNNFTVEYSLYDQATKVSGTVSKNYGTITFHVGKNKKVVADLPVPHYLSDIYYMWDAKVGEHVWKGYEKYQPILNGKTDGHYPFMASDARWYNPIGFPTSASRSAKDCPNANELLWYALKGDPHWDPSIWSIMKHLYAGGMWLKKRATIAKENGKTLQALKAAAPGGTDYTREYPTDPKIYTKYVTNNEKITVGKPADSSNYIFLPTYGYYLTGTGELKFVGRMGYYWSSTPRPDENLNGYNLYVERNKVHTGYGDRKNAHCLWPE
ncbi:hypothetical protein CTM53_07840 [Prevotella intermedia]|uniref:Fimbrillin family protein n=1 Tax=Prevotella intermedia TaxID=28131 RepID=A0AAJ3RTF6_PREIN|nr:hypothetical protein [Prevotella intermedia]ATV54270.1 hypothetical protein CTM61_01800 [Prevotella intermedia]PJI20729.1 hypothetical protein CTM53_07840 [Prevotella intermedia]